MNTTANYFVRHWRGELSLPFAYWINGCLFAGGLSIALQVAVTGMEAAGYSLRSISFAVIGYFLLSVSLWLWSVVGIWRSADSHVVNGGSRGWATTAKAMVVLGALAMSQSLMENVIPQMREFWLIATGRDPLGELDLKISSDGKTLTLTGAFREGSASKLETLLGAAPSVTSIALNSYGGRLLEAKRIADVVWRKQLDTFVEVKCESACTYVFLAGRDRAATPNAKIGFHQPSFEGLSAEEQAQITEDMLNVYRAAQIPKSFLTRIEQTPSSDMWYPTREELISANVVTRVTFEGEVAPARPATESEIRAAGFETIRLICAYEYSINDKGEQQGTSGEDLVTTRFRKDGHAMIRKGDSYPLYGTITEDEINGESEYSSADALTRSIEEDVELVVDRKETIKISRYTGAFQYTMGIPDHVVLTFYGTCRQANEQKF